MNKEFFFQGLTYSYEYHNKRHSKYFIALLHFYPNNLNKLFPNAITRRVGATCIMAIPIHY